MMKKRLPETSFNFHDTDINIVDDNQAEVITTIRLNGNRLMGNLLMPMR